MIVDLDTIAEILGMTPSRVQQLCAKGLPKHARGQYDARVCIRWYIDYKLATLANSSDVSMARRRLYDVQTEKIGLEVDKIRSESIPAGEHMADMRELQRIFEAALDAVDAELPQALAGLVDARAVAHRITQANNAIRTRVADALVAYAGTVEG